MKIFNTRTYRILCYCLAVTLLIPLAPSPGDPVRAAGATITNSATVVDLDDLRSKISDHTDTDADGLWDQVEKILGTDPALTDTDGDGLDDLFEAENGLDPLKSDTNGDGLQDLYEITLGNDQTEITAALVVTDSDSDGTANILDTDNDNDGISDALDISPFTSLAAAESRRLTVRTTNNPVFIKIQIQPADIQSLYENNQILSWPVDKYGQVTNIDSSEGNLRVTPMLEVIMATYPDLQTQQAYGYLYTGDSMLVPLQYLEENGSFVGLEATIYLPAGTGTEVSSGIYETNLDLKLAWMLSGAIDNIAADWGSFYDLTYNGKTIKLYDVDYDSDKEYLGSDIGDINGNGIPDLAVYWSDSSVSLYSGRTISYVRYRYFYDLVFNADEEVYEATSWDPIQNIYTFTSETPSGWVNKDDDPDTSFQRVYNGKYALSIDNWAYYGWEDDLVLHAYPSFSHSGDLYTNRGSYSAGDIDLGSREFYGIYETTSWFSTQEISILKAKASTIRDSAYRYDETNDIVWYLYEQYDTGSEANELILKKNRPSGASYLTETSVLRTIPDTDAQTMHEYRAMDELRSGLSLDLCDVNGDGELDLMLTDRTGRMYIITSCNDTSWESRLIRLPFRVDREKVLGQDTGFFDFDGNGGTDLFCVQAVSDKTNFKADLSLRLGLKTDIEQNTMFLSRDYEPFSVTGFQIDEQNGTDTAVVISDDTERMLNMGYVLEYTYLNGTLSINDVISEYQTYVLDTPGDITVTTGSYPAVMTAILANGETLYNLSQGYSVPHPILLMTNEQARYLNLDELTDTAFTGSGVLCYVSGADVVTRKQLSLTWMQNGRSLDQHAINTYVQNNPDSLPSFEEDKHWVTEHLARWNNGLSAIVKIGADEAQAIASDMRVTCYDIATYPGAIISAVDALFDIKAPLQTIANIGWQYEVQLARYSAYTRVGQAAGALGHVANVAIAVHSGYLYGQQMANIGGTTYGVVTGITYGVLILASGYLYTALAAIGPVGWVIAGILVIDTLIAYFVDDYDGVVATVITQIMTWLYDAKKDPGTIIRYIRETDNDAKNRQTITGAEFGFTIGTEVATLAEYETLVRAATKSTPANKESKLDDSWARIWLWNESNTVTVDNTGDLTYDTTYKSNSYWYHKRRYEFDNVLVFEKAGMNLPVEHYSRISYRLIEEVTTTRYVCYEDYEYEWDSDSDKSMHTGYYDVVPDEMDIFWNAFTFLTDTTDEPEVKQNELLKLDPDGDGLLSSGAQEIDRDGNTIASSPFSHDTDGDGISDYYEVVYGTDPTDADSDDDLLSDREELIVGTDPLTADTDGDGIDDKTEVSVTVAVTITTDGGTTGAQAYSSPVFADTDGDGIGDATERAQEMNPASKFTNGQLLFDGNTAAPVQVQSLPDTSANPQETLTRTLPDHFTDADGDDLVFEVSHGSVSDDGTWTYVFDTAADGNIVEIQITAFDLKNGTISVSFLVYDTTSPFVTGVTASQPGGPVAAETPSLFETLLTPNPVFTLTFSEAITLIDTSGIMIAPVTRSNLDIDLFSNPLSTATTVTQTSPTTVTITRIAALVENGIRYTLTIPAGALNDLAGNPLNESYELTFTMLDTVAPKLVSLSSPVDLNNPLTATFNEQINLRGSRMYVEAVIGGEKPPVLVDVSGSTTLQSTVMSNQLNSATAYQLYDPSGGFAFDVADLSGNTFQTPAVTIDPSIRSFTTGHVAGPRIITAGGTVFTEAVYVVTITGGEIRITFDEPLLAGPDFGSIVVSYDRSIAYWDTSLRSDIKRAKLDAQITIDNNQLVIVPNGNTPFDAFLSYAVFIPERALKDSEGNYIKETWPDEDHYLVVYAQKAGAVSPQIKAVATITDTSIAGYNRAMIQSYNPPGELDPGRFVLAVFPDEVEQASGGDIGSVTIWKQGDSGETQAAINDVILPPNASAGFGSFVMVIIMEENLEADSNYLLKVPADIIETSTGSPSVKNAYQEVAFSTGGTGITLNGGTDLDESVLLGMRRAGEQLWTPSKYQKYINMVGGQLTFQWYNGDTVSPGLATPITGATNLWYVPAEGDVNKYLFLKLTFDYQDGQPPREIMTNAIGPILPAFLTNADLTSISVKNNGTELLNGFSNDTLLYDLAVPISMASVKVNATYDGGANQFVSINGQPAEIWQPDNGLDIPLRPGFNVIVVTSIAENYLANKAFVIRIERRVGDTTELDDIGPEAQRVTITNNRDAFTGMTLNGAYTYFDELGREEEGTTFQWYRQDDENGTNKAAIAGATGTGYAISSDDIGKYLTFEVTPVCEGTIGGNPSSSWWTGSVRGIDDTVSGITNIGIIYNGAELVTGYSPVIKLYQAPFSYIEGTNDIVVTVTGGTNVTIAGTSVTTATLDLTLNPVVVVTADASDNSGTTSYYIVLRDEVAPGNLTIDGATAVDVTGGNEVTVFLDATLTDQYGELLSADISWTIPAGFDYTTEGTENQVLKLTVPTSTVSQSVVLTASSTTDPTVSATQNIAITGANPPVGPGPDPEPEEEPETGTEPADETSPDDPGGKTVSVPIRVFGGDATLELDQNGVVRTGKTYSTSDKTISLTVLAGTACRDAEGTAIGGITAEVVPPPVTGSTRTTCVAACTFGPSGATFDPPLVLAFDYSPEELAAAGIDETELTIAVFNESSGLWEIIPCEVDIENNRVTAAVSHFSTYGLIGIRGDEEETLSQEPADDAVTPDQNDPEQASVDETDGTDIPTGTADEQPSAADEETTCIGTIEEDGGGINWWLIGGIIAGMILLSVVITGYVMWKKEMIVF